MEENLPIIDGVVIWGSELSVTASRSGGAGGQHVNKTNSRVTLQWDIANSSAVNEEQRARLSSRLKTRISREGLLTIHVESERSQHANRETARKRLADMVRDALRVDKVRKPTRVSKAQKERRLDEKKKRGETKRQRSKPEEE